MLGRFFMYLALLMQAFVGVMNLLTMAAMYYNTHVETWPQLFALSWCLNLVSPFLVTMLYCTEDRTQRELYGVPSNQTIVLGICALMFVMPSMLIVIIQSGVTDPAQAFRHLIALTAAPTLMAIGLGWKLKQEYFWN